MRFWDFALSAGRTMQVPRYFDGVARQAQVIGEPLRPGHDGGGELSMATPSALWLRGLRVRLW